MHNFFPLESVFACYCYLCFCYRAMKSYLFMLFRNLNWRKSAHSYRYPQNHENAITVVNICHSYVFNFLIGSWLKQWCMKPRTCNEDSRMSQPFHSPTHHRQQSQERRFPMGKRRSSRRQLLLSSRTRLQHHQTLSRYCSPHFPSLLLKKQRTHLKRALIRGKKLTNPCRYQALRMLPHSFQCHKWLPQQLSSSPRQCQYSKHLCRAKPLHPSPSTTSTRPLPSSLSSSLEA